MPEPASVALRRLDREATAGPWTYDGIAFLFGPEGQMVADDGSNAGTIEMRGVGACLPLDRNAALIVALRNALPEIAALVASVEECTSLHCRPGGLLWQGVTSPPCRCSHCVSLSALRERLAAKS